MWNYWLNQWKFLFKTSPQTSSISHSPLLDARKEILMWKTTLKWQSLKTIQQLWNAVSIDCKLINSWSVLLLKSHHFCYLVKVRFRMNLFFHFFLSKYKNDFIFLWVRADISYWACPWRRQRCAYQNYIRQIFKLLF